MTQPTGDRSTEEHFPDAGQVEFDAESAPDEAHVDGGPRETAAPPVGPEGPFDEPVADPAAGEGSELESRIAELTSDLQRLQAEYLNYKRRVDRDREVVVANAKLTVLNSLLPVLDDVDRAREHEELSGGFKAVAEALERVVAGAGLEKFGAKGDEFDPRLHEALKAADQLAAFGLSATVADARFAKPLDHDLIRRLAQNHEVLVTVEEGSVGGFGSHVLQYLANAGLLDGGLKVRPMVLPDVFIDHDKPEKMYATAGLDAQGIVATVLATLGREVSADMLAERA